MAKIKFLGVPGEDHKSISQYGYQFPLGKAVTVDDPFAVRKLKTHPHFGVDDAVTDVAFKEKPKLTRAELEQTAAGLDIKVDGRWSDERLISEIQREAGTAK